MNQRAEALEILKRARDLLQEQLVERVVAARDEILADALGLSYAGEIDALYEQVGARLSRVQSMLANLPPALQETSDEPVGPQPSSRPALPSPRISRGAIVPPSANPRTSVVSAGGAVPVMIAGEQGTVPDGTQLWRNLALAVHTRQAPATAAALSRLFELTPEQAQRCAAFFLAEHADHSAMLRRVVALHQELAGNATDAVLRLSWECFGAAGLEAVGARFLEEMASKNNPDKSSRH